MPDLPLSEKTIQPENDQAAMQALRDLIVGPEQEKIEVLETHLNEISHPVATVEDIARALPESIRLRISEDQSLQHALQPVTEQAIQESVRNNPKPLSDALFPIMGPAIRKSINHTINTMLQSMNQAVENSFSIQGIRWRIQAMRSDKTFAEIVLLNTLVYRVEQIFVIHRESGLLIQHIANDGSIEEDADLISSMLTAVTDFVRDSFAPGSNEAINNLRMGEMELLIGQSPHITLALVCRGSIPHDLYSMMDEHLELLQREYARAFANFDGDTSLFVGIKDMLRPLMVSDYREREERKKFPIHAFIVIIPVMLALLAWFGWAWYQQRQWHDFIQTLRNTAGIVVLHEKKNGNHFVLYGMLDPQAKEPVTLLPPNLSLKNIAMHWRPYYSFEEALVFKRIVQRLKPPPEAVLSFTHGMLTARGAAPAAWISHIKLRAPLILGVLTTDIQLRDMDLEPLADKIARLLMPPDTIVLTLKGLALTMQGETTQGWLKQAKNTLENIGELQSHDETTVLVLDSPAYLLQQAMARLQPPTGITLSVDKKRVLHAHGKTLTAWAKLSRKHAVAIPYLASYHDTDLLLLDAPAYLKKQAVARLKPPKSVALSVSSDHVLHARGEATAAWIKKARIQAKKIRYITQYRDGAVIDPFDRARVLRAARKKLKPPKGITLDYRQGRLYAGGKATTDWIARAQTLAPKIRGVMVYDDRQVINVMKEWYALRASIQGIHLSFQAGTATFAGESEQKKIKNIAELFIKAHKLSKYSRLKVTGISSLYGDSANKIASQRAVLTGKILLNQGIRAMQQITAIKVARSGWGVEFDLVDRQKREKQ
ncbi:MAG: hypothetical protein Q9M22_00295 [Mariprofundaceae bacterium]|nr:hypothetical protein [Mariprofundaceae bacterium]